MKGGGSFSRSADEDHRDEIVAITELAPGETRRYEYKLLTAQST